ncbi:MAG TPA: hypothetical protein VF322_14110 [Gammaproteobacteria bacterium]
MTRAAAARVGELIRLARFDDVTLLVVAGIYAVGFLVMPVLGLVGVALALLLVLSLCKYGYTLLRWVAQGKRELPGPGWDTMSFGGDRRALLHFVFFAALAFLIAVTPWLPDGELRVCLAAGVVALFPASAALMALTGDLAAAMSPRRVTALVAALGARYAAILVGWTALFALSFGAMAVLRPGGSSLLLLLDILAAVWTFLAAFALTGAALRMARLEIDIPGDVETRREELDRRDVIDRRQRALDRAYASLRSGLTAAAYRTIEELVNDEGESTELHLWIVNRMSEWDFPHHAVAVGVGFIERSLARGEPDAALELYVLCRRLDGRFAPRRADASALAAHARLVGRRALAEQLEEGLRG